MNLDSLVGHAVELLTAIEQSSEPADRIVSGFLRKRSYIGSRDRRFISETVYGIIRNRRYLEALLEHFLDHHPSLHELNTPAKRFLPIYHIYSRTFSERSTDNASSIPTSAWKITFPSIDLEEFIAWIDLHRSLDFLPSDTTIQLGVKYSFQDWMVKNFQEQFADETEALLVSLNEPAKVVLRVNISKVSREECGNRLRGEGIETEPAKIAPAGLITAKRFNTHSSPAFIDGWYEVQDEGSQIVSLIANPQPGCVVIDACAGAGGKTLHMADMMRGEGEIIAIDVDRHRLEELRRRAARAGIGNIGMVIKGEMQPENFFRKADIVLVDAPCSGVGTIRRNPVFKWRVDESLLQHYVELQREVLEFNARFVKPGGKLVYSTCSLFHQENDGVVKEFLASHSSFAAVRPEMRLRELGVEQEGTFVWLTPHRHRTDGFFIAVLECR